jgi:hypothetical protein
MLWLFVDLNRRSSIHYASFSEGGCHEAFVREDACDSAVLDAAGKALGTVALFDRRARPTGEVLDDCSDHGCEFVEGCRDA